MTSDDFPSRPERRPLREEKGLALLAQAQRQFAQAQRARSEPMTRAALAVGFDAFNWLEDTRYQERAHRFLHKSGAWTRRAFPRGCALVWANGGYEHRCPVALAHLRVGLSAGMIVRIKRCTFCGQDASECPHMTDREYLVPGGPGPLGRCRACGEEVCHHKPSRRYWARPSRIVEPAEIREVSLVSRPVQPTNRLIGQPIDGARLQAVLGPAFRYGVDAVSCSECLQPCQGFQRMAEDPVYVGLGATNQASSSASRNSG